MPWFRVDDKAHSHRKLLKAGLEAAGLWALAGSYCMDHLTDGVVPREWVEEKTRGRPELADDLVEAGLWVKHPDGWLFHDWEERQPSAAEILAERHERSVTKAIAGRIGGQRSAEARRSREQADEQQGSSRTEADDQAEPKQTASRAQAESKPHTHTHTQREERESARARAAPPDPPGVSTTRLRAAAPADGSPVGATAPPDALEVPDEFIAACTIAGLPDPRLHVEAFLANARAKGLTFVDWLAALRVWVTRQRSFDAGRRTRAGPTVQPPAASGPSWADRNGPPDLADWAKEHANGTTRPA